jgi:hypothetical protein
MHPIVGIASWFVLLAPFVLLSVDVTRAADNLEKQTKALDIIADFANRLCETVPQTGTSGNVELSGKAKAELNELLKKVANLGIEGAAKYQALEWKGVLQQELAEQLNRSRSCKLEVFKDLKDRLLSVGPSRPEPEPTAPAPPPAAASSPLPLLGYIPSLGAQVTSLNFFEGPNNTSPGVPPRRQRKYAQRFSKNISNYYSSNIYWDLCLEYPSKGSSNDFSVHWKILDEDNKHVYGASAGIKLQANTNDSCHHGLIYQKLEPGYYRFNVYDKDKMVASNSFEVF